MTFTTTFLPILGLGLGVFLCGLLFLAFRVIDCIVTALIRKP